MKKLSLRQRKRPWLKRFERLWRYRLLIPLKRSRHPPNHAAYGIMVGVAVAMTPTVGVQMAIVALIWLLSRHIFRWHFSLLLGCAWTWITNYLTAPPIYYAFYVAGQVILGNWQNLADYNVFTTLSENFFSPPELSAIARIEFYLNAIFVGWGIPILIGSIPFSIIGGGLAYWWSVRFITRYRDAQTKRRHRRNGKKKPQSKNTEIRDATNK